VLVETLAVGVCGTDIEITSGAYGWPPAGRERLVLGHESLGRVLEAPAGAAVAAGDLVVGIVRRPDAVPCANCAVGEWDFCHNGQYTERGIKQRDGYCSERYRIEPDFVVKLDPALGRCGGASRADQRGGQSVGAGDRIGGRAHWAPMLAVITGAGPIGLLAALIAVQRGMEVHVLDQVTSGLKPDLVAALGATYHTGTIEDACPRPMWSSSAPGQQPRLRRHGAHGSERRPLLTGVSSGGHSIDVDAGTAQPFARSVQPGDRRIGERQPTSLRGGGGGTGPGRPRLARAPREPQGATGPLLRSAGPSAR